MKIIPAAKIYPLRKIAAKDTNRDVLKCVYLDKENGCAVATDGHKLLYHDIKEVKTLDKSLALEVPDFKRLKARTMQIHTVLFIPETGKPILADIIGNPEDYTTLESFANAKSDLCSFTTCQICDSEYPNWKQCIPESSRYIQSIMLDLDILKEIGTTLEDGKLEFSIPTSNIAAVRIHSEGYAGLIMPLRFTEATHFENDCIRSGHRAKEILIERKKEIEELQARVKELELLVEQERENHLEETHEVRSEFEAATAAAEPPATYKQVRCLAVLTDEKWQDLRTLTKRQASERITQLMGKK